MILVWFRFRNSLDGLAARMKGISEPHTSFDMKTAAGSREPLERPAREGETRLPRSQLQRHGDIVF
jgi:hypothetical protein